MDHEQPAILWQNTYDRGFAVLCRHDRDANVDIRAPCPEPRRTVLRQTTLSDIEAGHNLDAGDHGLRQHASRRRDRPQQAVDAHTNYQAGMKGLDMNVTRAQFDCFFQKIIDGANHGRTAGEVPQTLDVVFARLK